MLSFSHEFAADIVRAADLRSEVNFFPVIEDFHARTYSALAPFSTIRFNTLESQMKIVALELG